MTRPVVLSLDAADTLFTERRTRAELYAEAFTEAGAPYDAASMAVAMEAEHDAVAVDEPAYSHAWFVAFIAALLARVDSPLDPEPLRARIAERFLDPRSYRVFDDVPAALERCRAAGQRLVLVSNWSDRLPGLLEALGLARPFEALVISHVERLTKPDPRLYARAAERLGVTPAELLHVGDHPTKDVTAAREAGCAAWWLDRSGGHSGDDVVHDLLEVVGRLGL